MEYKGAVFFDSDGTLADDKADIFEPTPATLRALDKLKKNGYLPVLCTGRALPYAGAAKYFDAAILSNGAYAICGNEVVFDFSLDTELVRELIDFMDKNDIIYMLDNPKRCYGYMSDNPKRCYSNGADREEFIYWIERFKIDKCVFSGKKEDFPEKVRKIGAIFKNKEQILYLKEKYKDVLCIDIQHGFMYADIYGCEISKGGGVRRFIKHFGINTENTYAIGDGANDVSMMNAVGHGIAMGVHDKALDGVCDFVTKSIADEGVSFALEHYNLI